MGKNIRRAIGKATKRTSKKQIVKPVAKPVIPPAPAPKPQPVQRPDESSEEIFIGQDENSRITGGPVSEDTLQKAGILESIKAQPIVGSEKKTPKSGIPVAQTPQVTQIAQPVQAPRTQTFRIHDRVVDKFKNIYKNRILEAEKEGLSETSMRHIEYTCYRAFKMSLQEKLDTNLQIQIFGRDMEAEVQHFLTQVQPEMSAAAKKATQEISKKAVTETGISFEAIRQEVAKKQAAKIAKGPPTGQTKVIPSQNILPQEYKNMAVISPEYFESLLEKELSHDRLAAMGCTPQSFSELVTRLHETKIPRQGCLGGLVKYAFLTAVLGAAAVYGVYSDPITKDGDFDGDGQIDRALLYQRVPYLEKKIHEDSVMLGQKDGSYKSPSEVFEAEKKLINDKYDNKIARLKAGDTRRKAIWNTRRTKALSKNDQKQKARFDKIMKRAYAINPTVPMNTSRFRRWRR